MQEINHRRLICEWLPCVGYFQGEGKLILKDKAATSTPDLVGMFVAWTDPSNVNSIYAVLAYIRG